ncbi:MAG: glycosyltransferase [Thaumarchaeota archaeon]|nr:glycosyltransferase [Nitrososphaerota archaeon]MDE1875686.1 glycosyltransferase [Nitrososphaerota archaeon]
MKKIGGFIYPWGNGHFTRMMHLDNTIQDMLKDDIEMHYTSSGEIYQKLLQKFPQKKDAIHNIEMPTPIDGKKGPSIVLSSLNFLLPISGRPPLLSVVTNYLKKEARLYNSQKFDLVVNDGDVGSNAIAQRRNIKCVFITNQFRPKLWTSRFYLYPGVLYVSKNIEKATKIVVADSPPPYTICEYNLNFPERLKEKVVYAGHFSNGIMIHSKPKSNLEKIIENVDSFGYWMITGNKSTKKITLENYKKAFSSLEMREERRIISHASADPSLDKVWGKDGKTYSILEALEKKIDWIQIDIGFLSEQEKDTVLNLCKYAVINGSHTAMGEILGGKAKPIIGIPVYDEHTNQIKWAQDRNLGILATTVKQTVKAVSLIHNDYNKYQENLLEFSRNYSTGGTKNTVKIISEMLEN